MFLFTSKTEKSRPCVRGRVWALIANKIEMVDCAHVYRPTIVLRLDTVRQSRGQLDVYG